MYSDPAQKQTLNECSWTYNNKVVNLTKNVTVPILNF